MMFYSSRVIKPISGAARLFPHLNDAQPVRDDDDPQCTMFTSDIIVTLFLGVLTAM